MKTKNIYALVFAAITVFASNAFAIDQVVLKSGDVIEGKVLSEVPNLHVDIQLLNGNKKRYQMADVASVERDVPSNADTHMNGSTSEAYVGAQLGMLTSLDGGSGTNTLFIWGARGGVNVAQLGDFAKFAVGLSFTHYEQSATSGSTTLTAANNEILAQLLFRKVGDTGFYFGPEIGLSLVSLSISGTTAASGSTSVFTFGLDTGYDYYFSPGFSMGPDLRYERASSSGASLNTLDIMLTGTIHL